VRFAWLFCRDNQTLRVKPLALSTTALQTAYNGLNPQLIGLLLSAYVVRHVLTQRTNTPKELFHLNVSVN